MKTGGIAAQGPVADAAEGASKDFRTNFKGELIVEDRPKLIETLEGSYFKFLNPTMGTGIAQAIQTTFLDTNCVLLLRNTEGAGGLAVVVDYIRLINAVAGASTTRSEFAIILDNANRYSSGGTTLTVAQPNTVRADTTGIDIKFGNVTALAAVNKRQIGRGNVKPQTAAGCFALGDVVHFDFSGRFAGSMVQPIAAISGMHAYIPCGPAILGPGNNHSLLLHLWNVANATTAPSWEVEVGLMLRKAA